MSGPGKIMTELKAELRKRLLKARSGLSKKYCQQADRAILEKLLAQPVYRRAKVIFTYVSTEAEIDTGHLIRLALAAGKTVAVPKCTEKGMMKALKITGFKDLEKGARDILEPKAHCQEIEPQDIDLAVVPCVSCSRQGARLGYGGGYYDRYLTLTSAFRAVLCREQLICDTIPTTPFDCWMDLVITEKDGIFTKNGESRSPQSWKTNR